MATPKKKEASAAKAAPAKKPAAAKAAPVKKPTTVKATPTKKPAAAKATPAKKPAAAKATPTKKPATTKATPAKKPATTKATLAKKPTTAKAAPAKKPATTKATPTKKPAAAKAAPAKKPTATKAAPVKKPTATKAAPVKKPTATKATPPKKPTATTKATPAKKPTTTKAAPTKKPAPAKETSAKKPTKASDKSASGKRLGSKGDTLTPEEKARAAKLKATLALLKADPEWPAFLDSQKEMLLEMRDHLLPNMQNVTRDHLRSGASNVSSASGQHIGDAGSEAEVRDLTIRLLDKDREQLFQIDDALERIRMGTYGICEISLEPIPKKRLQVRPFCRLTVKCQEEYEKKYGAFTTFGAAKTGNIGFSGLQNVMENVISLDAEEE